MENLEEGETMGRIKIEEQLQKRGEVESLEKQIIGVKCRAIETGNARKRESGGTKVQRFPL